MSFFLYDCHFNISDQSPGDIIYCLSNNEQLNQDINQRYIVTGIITAINEFCKVFDDQSFCDYLITSDCENAILPIGEDLFFLLSLKLPNKSVVSSNMVPSVISSSSMNSINIGINKLDPNAFPFYISTPNTRKLILKNFLNMVKEILFLNIQPPKRDLKTGKFPDIFKREVNNYLPKILELMEWDNISYTHIWDSNVFITKLPGTSNLDFKDQLTTLQAQNTFVNGLILTNKNKVVAHTTEPELANILNFLIKKKYKVYFPIKLKKKNNTTHWIIGIINHENGCIKSKVKNGDFMSVVTPPVFWKNQNLALATLKYNMVKLIILIDLSQADLEIDLNNLKKQAEPILRQCDSFNSPNNSGVEKLKDDLDSRFKKHPGAKLSCNFVKNSIQILANRVQSSENDIIDFGIFVLNEVNLFIKKELMKSANIKSQFANNGSPNNSNDDRNLEEMNQIAKKEDNVQIRNNIESLIPFYFGFSLYFEQRNNIYSNLFMKIKPKGLTNALELMHMTDEII